MTLKNTKLAGKYLELIRERFIKLKNEAVLGCFLRNIVTDMEYGYGYGIWISLLLYGKKIKEKDEKFLKKTKQTDIRAMLGVTAQVSSSTKQQNGVEVIETD